MVRVRWARLNSDQIGDLKSEVTCYVIDVFTSYNLLLGRLWIHRNSIVLCTLHQVMKYANEWGRVRTLIVEIHPVKGVENYFIDSILYQDSLETDENLKPEKSDSDNERIRNQRQKKNIFGK